MYHLVIAQCIKTLKQIETYLDRAEKFAAAKDFDVAVLVNDRLAPDMNNFIYQVQSACDYVKAGAGWLSGQRPPKHEDNEQSIADLRARLQKTIAFAESVTEAQYVGAYDRKIGLPWAPGKLIADDDYLLQIVVPTPFFTSRWRTQFCATTASNLESGTFLGRCAGLKDSMLCVASAR